MVEWLMFFHLLRHPWIFFIGGVDVGSDLQEPFIKIIVTHIFTDHIHFFLWMRDA